MKCLSIESFEYYYFIPIISQLAEYWGDVKMASLGKIMSQQVKQHLLHANDLHFLLSSSFPIVNSKRKESKIKRFQNKEQLKDYLLFSNQIHTLLLTEKSFSIFPRDYEESVHFSYSYLSIRKRFVEQKDLIHRASYNLVEDFQNSPFYGSWGQRNLEKINLFQSPLSGDPVGEFEKCQKSHSTLPISQMDPNILYTTEKKIDSSKISENQLKKFDSSKSSQLLNSNLKFQSYGNRREKKKKNKFSMENFSSYGLEEEKKILSQLYRLDYFFFQLLNKTKREEFQKHEIVMNLFSDLVSFLPVYESVFCSSEQIKVDFTKPIEQKNKIVDSIWETSGKDLYFLFLQILRDRKIWKAEHWYPFLSGLSFNSRFLSFSHMLSSSYELTPSSKIFLSSNFRAKGQNNLGQDPSRTRGSTKELIEKKMYCSFMKFSESEKKMSELITILMNK
jgi:hypothetical protein